MGIFFSATTLGFYPSELQDNYEAAGAWPSDAVDMSTDEVSMYWGVSPPPGKILGAASGRPVFIDIISTLSEAVLEQVSAIDAACASSITAGFTSTALDGKTEYTYPSKVTDQANLSSSVLASLLPGNSPDWATPFWCADPSGAWAYRSHTAAQIQAVGVDGKNAISACILKKISLEAQIAAATTVAEVQAIVWTAPGA